MSKKVAEKINQKKFPLIHHFFENKLPRGRAHEVLEQC